MIVAINIADVYIWMAINVTIFSYLTTQSKLYQMNEEEGSKQEMMSS